MFIYGFAPKYLLLPQCDSIADREIKALFYMKLCIFHPKASSFVLICAGSWWQQQEPAEAGPRKVETLLNFLHCNLEAAPRESREVAAAAAEARTNGHTAHGASQSALKSHESRRESGRKRSIDHTPG